MLCKIFCTKLYSIYKDELNIYSLYFIIYIYIYLSLSYYIINFTYHIFMIISVFFITYTLFLYNINNKFFYCMFLLYSCCKNNFLLNLIIFNFTKLIFIYYCFYNHI